MKHIALAITFCLLLTAGLAISLEESVELARRNNKPLLMAQEEVDKADQTYYDVRSNLLPHLTLSSGYSLTKTFLPKSAQIPAVDFSLGLDTLATYNDQYLAGIMSSTVNSLAPSSPMDEGSLAISLQFQQVLFMGGKLLNGIRAVDRYRSIQRLRFQLAEQEMVLATTQLFYGCLLTDKLVEVQRQALETAQGHLARIESFNREGLVSEFDLLRARLEVAKLEPQLLQAENSRDLALAAFRKQLGSADEALTPEGQFILPPRLDITLEEALRLGKEQRIELELADIATQVAQIKWNAEKGNYLPNVAIQASASLYTAADEFAISGKDFGTSYTAGIGLSLPVFTGFSNTAKRKAAQHDYQYARLQQQDYEDLIALQIRQNYQKLRHAEENYQVQTQNIQMAERGLQLAQVRYENQVGIQLEVFDAQTMLAAIRLQYYQAIYEVITAQRELQKSLGQSL